VTTGFITLNKHGACAAPTVTGNGGNRPSDAATTMSDGDRIEPRRPDPLFPPANALSQSPVGTEQPCGRDHGDARFCPACCQEPRDRRGWCRRGLSEGASLAASGQASPTGNGGRNPSKRSTLRARRTAASARPPGPRLICCGRLGCCWGRVTCRLVWGRPGTRMGLEGPRLGYGGHRVPTGIIGEMRVYDGGIMWIRSIKCRPAYRGNSLGRMPTRHRGGGYEAR
jgi:hypothetical protein